MSKFGRDAHERLARAHAQGLADLPGVKVTRRLTMRMSLAGLVATIAGCTADAPRSDGDGGDASAGGSDSSSGGSSVGGAGGEGGGQVELPPIGLDELVTTIHPDAVALIAAASPDDENYNAAVEALLARLSIMLPDLFPSSYVLDPLATMAPVEVFQIEMAPGAEIPLHDHRDYIGSILTVEGSASTTYYTQISQPDGQGWFQLQRGKDAELLPGQTASLGIVDDNFHVVRAGDAGASLVDVFTFFDPSGTSYFAELDPTPIDAGQGIFRARFT